MKHAFRAFMDGLIDYAGFFPPAALDLETSLKNFTRYRSEKYGWMLGRCVLPAAELQNIREKSDMRYSVIVSTLMPAEEKKLLRLFSDQIEMVEINIGDVSQDPEKVVETLTSFSSHLAQVNLKESKLFIESARIEPVARAISLFNTQTTKKSSISMAGYKLRCGGVTAEAYPTVEKVAEVITSCCNHKIPVKFTGGLHQPIRNRHKQLDIMQHGFLNVFAASLLYTANRIDHDQIIECLNDDNNDNMLFTDEHFSWKSHALSTVEISKLRKQRIISYGSCSFDEPLEGLALLGLL